MPGAYTAKPAVTPDPPDVPPGWGGPDIPGSGGPGGTSPDGELGGVGNWPFPPVSGGGPFPPGYEPDYSFNTTVPSETGFGTAVSVSTQLRDQTNYTTGEPSGTCSIIWSATVNGLLRRIRFDDVGSYESSVSSSYTLASSFWGASPILDVELTNSDIGETLVIALTSEVGGFTVTDSGNISIINEIAVLTLELISYTPYGSNYRSIKPNLYRYINEIYQDAHYGLLEYDSGNGYSYEEDESAGEVAWEPTGYVKVTGTITPVAGTEYRIYMFCTALVGMYATFRFTIVYKGDTTTKDVEWGNIYWINIDEDGGLTVITP